MKKGKIFWLAVIAALVLVPTLPGPRLKRVTTTTVSTTGLPATEPSFFVEIYGGGGGASSVSNLYSKCPCRGVAGYDRLPWRHCALFSGRLEIWLLVYALRDLWHDSMPDWMKYFGLYTDFSYQKLNFCNQTG